MSFSDYSETPASIPPCFKQWDSDKARILIRHKYVKTSRLVLKIGALACYTIRCTPSHAPWGGALGNDPKETTKRTRHID